MIMIAVASSLIGINTAQGVTYLSYGIRDIRAFFAQDRKCRGLFTRPRCKRRPDGTLLGGSLTGARSLLDPRERPLLADLAGYERGDDRGLLMVRSLNRSGQARLTPYRSEWSCRRHGAR